MNELQEEPFDQTGVEGYEDTDFVSVEQLDLISKHIEEGVISVEDVNSAYDIARRYEYSGLLKLSPRLINRREALESIDALKAIVSKPIAIGIIGVVIGILVKFLLGSSEGGGGGGGGGGGSKKRIKELEEAIKKQEAALAELDKNRDAVSSELTELANNADITEVFKDKNDSIVKFFTERGFNEGTAIKKAEQLSKELKTYATFLGYGEDVTNEQAKLFEKFIKEGDLKISKNLDNADIIAKHKFLTIKLLSSKINTGSSLKPVEQDYIDAVSRLHQIYENDLLKVYDVITSDWVLDNFDYENVKSGNVPNAFRNIEGMSKEIEKHVFHPMIQVLGLSTEQTYSANEINEVVSKKFGGIEGIVEKVANLSQELTDNYSYLQLSEIDFEQIESNFRDAKVISYLNENSVSYTNIYNNTENLSSWLNEKNKNEITGKIEKIREVTAKLKQAVKAYSSQHSMGGPAVNMASGRSKHFVIEVAEKIVTLWTKLLHQVGRITMFANTGLSRDRAMLEAYNAFILKSNQLYIRVNTILNGNSSNESFFPYANKEPRKEINITVNNNISINADELEIEDGIFHIPKSVILPDYLDSDALKDLVEEDPSEWSMEVFQEYIRDSVASLESLENDLSMVSSIHERLVRTKKVCKSDVLELESFRRGMITDRVPIGRFSSFESTTNYEISLENSDKLNKGMKVVAAVAGAAIIGKIIQWCIVRFQASRDVTKAIKSRVEVIKQKNSEAVGAIAGQNAQLEKLSHDLRGQLKANFKKKIESEDASIKLGPFDSFYNISDVEASLRKLRNLIFASKHERTFSELHEGMFLRKGPYKVLNDLADSTSDGAKLLDNAVDTAATQILSVTKNQGSNVEMSFKPIVYKISKNSEIKHPNAGNPALGEAVKSYIKEKESKKIGYSALSSMEVDKFASIFEEFAKHLEEVDGRIDKQFKKIEERLNKLEKENAKAAEKDNSSGSTNSSRDAIKSYLESIRSEFTAYSLLVGAQAGLLKMIDKELKLYESVLEKWSALSKWHAKEVSRLSKVKASEAPRDD